MAKYRMRKWKKTLTLVVASNTTVVTATGVDLNGILLSANIKTAAAVDSAATTAVKLTDADGIDVWTKTGVAVNTNTQTLLTNDQRVPLSGLYTVTVTFSAAQATNRDTDVSLLIDRGA
jgi:hypothetical protein